jgi:DNA-binding NarL/FixJ family response regulator
MSKVTVFICEDNDIVRLGLLAALGKNEEIDVVGSAGSATDTIQLVPLLQPDVLLVDVDLPDGEGIELTKQIKQSCPQTNVLVLTGSEAPEALFAAMGAGAHGYCSKKSPVTLLVLAILATRAGAAWFDPSVAVHLLHSYKTNDGQSQTRKVMRREAADGGIRLSVREREVLHLLCEGLSNRQIGERLVVSSETVKSHVARIMEKLDVGDRTQAAVKALRVGLLDAV